MKKISAIVLALVLVVAAFAAFGVSAAGEKATFTLDTTEKDGVLSVTVTFANADNFLLTNGGVNVFYDTETLELTGNAAAWGRNSVLPALTMKKIADGQVQGAFASSYALKDEDEKVITTGLAFTLTFKLKDGKTAGDIYLDVYKWEGGDSENEEGLVLNSTNYGSEGEASIAAPDEENPYIVEKPAEVTTVPTTTTTTPVVTTPAPTTPVATTPAPTSPTTGATAPIAVISLVALAGAGIAALSLKKRK